MVAAYIGLGSNLDDPVDQVNRALAELAGLPGTDLAAHSSLYRSRPMGGMDQPDYVNAVARVETSLGPQGLLSELQTLEVAHGRIRDEHWGARTLDLDLLLYGATIIDTQDLKLPHPGMHERAFVLYPLYEIAPDLEIPGRGKISDFMQGCTAAELKKV